MAGEPESLSTIEPLKTHVDRHGFDRLLMLSDGVFAIAMTLAAIEVHLPEHSGSFDEMVRAASRPVIAYLLSFGLTAIFWIQHRDLFARLRTIDRVMTALTLGMLCMIALIPATVQVVYAPGGTAAPFRFYAMTMMVCGLLVFCMWSYAALKPGMMRPEVPKIYRVGRLVASATMPIIFGLVLVMPLEETPVFILPIAGVMIVFRRFILPRWEAKAVDGSTS